MEIVRYWRLKRQMLSLIGEECPHCEVKIFPPRDICPRCGGGTLRNNLEVRMGNQGVLVVNDGVERRKV